MSGKVILLNGTSSSGKSSIAEELKNILPNFHHLSIDHFISGVPVSFHGVPTDLKSNEPGYHPTFSEDNKTLLDYAMTPMGYLVMERIHSAVSAFCIHEINVVFDSVITDAHMLKSAALQLCDQEVFFVGVRCAEEVRKKRELSRADRAVGVYKIKADFIYNECQYDIEVDTTHQSSLNAAHEIKKMMDLVSPNIFKDILRNS